MKKCCDMKGFLSFIVLKLISKKSISGEEIREELKERKGSMPSPGTIYPVLKALHENGFIKEAKIKESKSSGKTKKYELTKKGKKEAAAATRKFCRIFYDMKDEFQRC